VHRCVKFFLHGSSWLWHDADPVAAAALDTQIKAALQRGQGAVGVVQGERAGDFQRCNRRVAAQPAMAVAAQLFEQFAEGAFDGNQIARTSGRRRRIRGRGFAQLMRVETHVLAGLKTQRLRALRRVDAHGLVEYRDFAE
jgi:hypothetical protein